MDGPGFWAGHGLALRPRCSQAISCTRHPGVQPCCCQALLCAHSGFLCLAWHPRFARGAHGTTRICSMQCARSPRPMVFTRCPRPDTHVLRAVPTARDPCSSGGAHGPTPMFSMRRTQPETHVLRAVPTACSMRCPQLDMLLRAAPTTWPPHVLHALPTARNPCSSSFAHDTTAMFCGAHSPRPILLPAVPTAQDPCSSCGAHGGT